MKSNLLTKFDKSISIETKLLIPTALALLLFSIWFRDIDNGFFLASLFALITVLMVEFFMVIPKQYPRIWFAIKWIILMGVIILTLTSF